jgi:hypothetical protein
MPIPSRALSRLFSKRHFVLLAVPLCSILLLIACGSKEASVSSDTRPVITLANLPHGTAGVAYPPSGASSTVTATGGTTPYTFSATGLPSGLSINSSTGAVTGTPTCGGAAGCYSGSVAVTVTDGALNTATATYFIGVFPAQATYGGMWTAPGCTSTGYFQLMKINGHWVLADPECKVEPQFQMSDASSANLNGGVLAARYSGNGHLFADHALERMQDLGYTTIGDYSSVYTVPTTNNSDSLPSILMPTMIMMKPMSQAETVSAGNQYCNHGGRTYTLPIKNIIAGVPSSFGVYLNPADPMPDPWDGVAGLFFSDCVSANILDLQNGLFAGNDFSTNPWIVGLEVEDADAYYPFKFTGNNPYTPNDSPNVGFITAVACASFNGTGACALGYSADPTLHAKAQWCSYLQNKYTTVAAWNAAWGNGSYYTSFGSAGGYGSGTGCLDEDGLHGGSSAWLGTNAFVPSTYSGHTNATANVQTDLDQFVYNLAYQLFSTEVATIRAYDTNHLIFGPSALGGPCGYGMPAQVNSAMKAAGVQVEIDAYDPITSDPVNHLNCAANITAPLADYNANGMPFMLWVRTSANADSPENGHTSGAQADFSTQALRGEGYAAGVSTCFAAQASDGSYPCLGVTAWGLVDSTSEETSYGLLTPSDNVYDGNCAGTAALTDAYGIACGGESANYGPFIPSVAQAHIIEILALKSQTSTRSVEGTGRRPFGGE